MGKILATHEVEFNIPVGVTKEDPLRREVTLPRGIIEELDVVFPPGPVGLVGVRVFRGLHQVVPARYEDWLVGEDITFTHRTPVELLSEPYVLTLEGYNEDEVYDHTVIFRFTVRSPEPDTETLILAEVQKIPVEELRKLSEELVHLPERLEEMAELVREQVAGPLGRLVELLERQEREKVRELSLSELAKI